jgi:translation initiation factor 2D
LTLPGKEPILRKGEAPKIRIQVKLRSGNKKVTFISGLEAFELDPDVLSHQLKMTCASSTSISSLSNNKKEVLVQGDQLKVCCQLLRDEYGFPFMESGSGKKTRYSSPFVIM